MDKLLIFILILLILLISINLSFSSSYNIIEGIGNTGSSALETATRELKASFPSNVNYKATDKISIQEYIRDIKNMYENDASFRGKVEAYIREITIIMSMGYNRESQSIDNNPAIWTKKTFGGFMETDITIIMFLLMSLGYVRTIQDKSGIQILHYIKEREPSLLNCYCGYNFLSESTSAGTDGTTSAVTGGTTSAGTGGTTIG